MDEKVQKVLDYIEEHKENIWSFCCASPPAQHSGPRAKALKKWPAWWWTS